MSTVTDGPRFVLFASLLCATVLTPLIMFAQTVTTPTATAPNSAGTAATSTATSTASTTPVNPYADLESNYDAQLTAVLLEERFGQINRTLETSNYAGFSPEDEAQLRTSMFMLENAILSLRNELSAAVTAEVIIDDLVGYAQGRLLDSNNNPVTLDFYFDRATKPTSVEGYLAAVAQRAAESLDLNADALYRGAVVVQAFSDVETTFFRPTTTDNAGYVDTAPAGPSTGPVNPGLALEEFNDRTNLLEVSITGEVEGFDSAARVTFGPETVRGATYGTTSRVFDYDFEPSVDPDSDPITLAVDLRNQVMNDVTERTGLSTAAIEDVTRTSIKVFKDGDEARDYIDDIENPYQMFGYFGAFSNITAVTVRPGSEAYPGYNIGLRSDQGEFMNLSVSPDYEDYDYWRGVDYDLSALYWYDEEVVAEFRDSNLSEDEVRAGFINYVEAARIGVPLGSNNRTAAAELFEFLFFNNTHYDVSGYSASSSLTPLCHDPYDVKIVGAMLEILVENYNLAEPMEDLLTVSTTVVRDDGDGLPRSQCDRDERTFFGSIKEVGVVTSP